MRHPFRLLFATSLVLIGAHAPALAQQSDADWLESCRERSGRDRSDRRVTHCEVRPHEMRSQGSLTVDGGPNGGVAVRGWDGGDIRVSARVQTNARSDAEAQALARQVRVHAADGRVSAEGPSRQEGAWWSVSYEILVPRRMNLDVETRNGPVAVSDVAGRMSLRALNGPMSLHRVAGAVNARTTNGPLSVELAGSRWEGEGLDAETTNGPVGVRLPESYSAELEVGTVHGPVRIDVPLLDGYRSGKRFRTTLGSGGAPIRVVTTNGPLSVRRDER